MMATKKKDVKLDPVTLEVLRSALPAIANEMAVDLQRTSYNMMIYEVRDFCTALLLPNGDLVSQNVGGVSHFVSDLGVVVVDGVEKHKEGGFQPEDVIITNHQAVAGQHLNNMVIYMPYFFEGELVMFSMVRAHWIDVGGTSTGFGAGAQVKDPYEEGLQLDQLKIYEAGKLNKVLYKVIGDNIRFPESSLGDMRSQMAACRLALRRLDELFGKFGRDTMLAAISQIFDETEAKCRKVVKTIPNGVYEASSFLDDDGIKIGEHVELHAKLTVKDGHMIIDLSECSKERRAGINSRTLAGARVAYKALTAPLEPVNEGSFRALDVVLPEGNMMMARYPAPMAGWSTPIPTVVDTIITALAQAWPEHVPAAHLGTLGGAVVFYGINPQTRRRFIIQSIEGGGWGGRPHEDGESGTVSVCQGDVRNGAIEAIELKCPVLIEERGLRADSGGPGKFRGGLGQNTKVLNFIEGRWNLQRPPRIECPPWGIRGGKPGGHGDYLLRTSGDNEFKIVDETGHLTPPDSEVIVMTGGGGGWGNPFERDPEMVRNDVLDGYVTKEAASRDYGVVLTGAQMTVDAAATEQLRAGMRRAAAAE
jgi:N-methylhydantoinase B